MMSAARMQAERERVLAAEKVPHFVRHREDGWMQPGMIVWHDDYAQKSDRLDVWPLWDAVVQLLDQLGFGVHLDRRTRHCKYLRMTHRRGAIGRLRCKAERSGRILTVAFYADPSPEHTYPEFGHNVARYLPYIDRLRMRRALAALWALAAEHGYADASPPVFTDAYDAVDWNLRTSGHWRSSDTGLFDRPAFLADRERSWLGCARGGGARPGNGEWRLFYGYGGRLGFGQVFPGLNSTYHAVSVGGAEHWAIQMGDILPAGARWQDQPRFDPVRLGPRLKGLLRERLDKLALEEAIPIRDRLRTLEAAA